MNSTSIERIIELLKNYNFMVARATRLINTPEKSWDLKSMNYAAIKPSTPTNQINSIVESIVVHEVGEGKELQDLIKGIKNINYALEKIDTIQKEIVIMRYIDGLTWNEIEWKVPYEKRQCQRIATKGLKNIAGILDKENYNQELPLYKYLQEMEELGLKK